MLVPIIQHVFPSFDIPQCLIGSNLWFQVLVQLWPFILATTGLPPPSLSSWWVSFWCNPVQVSFVKNWVVCRSVIALFVTFGHTELNLLFSFQAWGFAKQLLHRRSSLPGVVKNYGYALAPKIVAPHLKEQRNAAQKTDVCCKKRGRTIADWLQTRP